MKTTPGSSSVVLAMLLPFVGCAGAGGNSPADASTTDGGGSDSATDTPPETGGATHNSPASGCDATQTPEESFTGSDAPETVGIDGYSFSVSTPWGYGKSDNANRVYPIVVNGCWGEGPLFTEDVRQRYPSFYMEYQECDNDEQGATLSEVLDVLLAQEYRIDLNRVYLTGFSKGGSGSYKLVRGFLSEGRLFSAIVRIAGQSESVLPDEAVAQTSIWYHVGTEDEPARVQVAQDAYDFLKTHPYNQTATETSATDSLTGFDRTTLTLTKNNVEIVKYSVSDGMGHVREPPYEDPYLYEWLFAQSLACRPL